jgi:hypothetical protein
MTESDTQILMERGRISEAICRWTACLDQKDWIGFGDQFTDPVEVAFASVDWSSEVPPRLLSREQWVNTVRTSLRHFSMYQHMATIYKIQVQGSDAYAETYVIAPHVVLRLGHKLFLNMGGFYQEHLVKIDGAWKITKHKLNLLWTHGDPEAMALISHESGADDLK